MNKQWVQPLFDAPLDIIGDIHGEIEALQKLMQVLGYDQAGHHPQHRKLIFVGDLCDRGINSPAVIYLVKQLIENGNAQCVLGNHELNLLTHSHREGNGWFFGSPHMDDDKSFDAVSASSQDQAWIVDFLNTLPLALVSNHMRIAHACWHPESLAMLQQQDQTDIKTLYDAYQQQSKQDLIQSGLQQLAQQEQQQYATQLYDATADIPLLWHIAKKDVAKQMANPIRIITSGSETVAQHPFFAAGKWRMTDRMAWWDDYQDDIPVVVGHYWRNFKPSHEKTGLFQNIDALNWFGAKKNVFCVDYSVGKRYLDRNQQREFSSCLAALRFPEKVLVLEDGTVYPTH